MVSPSHQHVIWVGLLNKGNVVVLEQPSVGHEIGNGFLLRLAFPPKYFKMQKALQSDKLPQECENVAYFPAAPHGTIAFFNVDLQLLEWAGSR